MPLFVGTHDQQDELRHILKSCHYYIAENLDQTELLPWLQTYDVLTIHEAESIKACVTSFKQNYSLMDCIQRKSNLQLETFIQGLIECNQRHLARKIDPSGD